MENDGTKINVDAVNNAITLFQAATQTFEGEELKVSSESFFNGLIHYHKMKLSNLKIMKH